MSNPTIHPDEPIHPDPMTGVPESPPRQPPGAAKQRYEECDISLEDEAIFDEVTKKILEKGWDNLPDGF